MNRKWGDASTPHRSDFVHLQQKSPTENDLQSLYASRVDPPDSFSSSCCATACQSDWDTTQEWKSQCRISLQISLVLVWVSISWWGGNNLFIDPQTFILHPAASLLLLLLSSLLQTAKVRLMHNRKWHKWVSWPLVNSHGPVNLERVQQRGRNYPSRAAWAVQTVQ